MNKVITRNDWSFKEENKALYPVTKGKNKKNKFKAMLSGKKKKVKVAPGEWRTVHKKMTSEEFYKSDDWRRLRYRVLKKYDACCMACGRSKRDHGVVIHVDHINPRSTHPTLQLAFDNLQVLCEDCNIGKGNKDCIDYRPQENSEDVGVLISAMERI